MSLLPSPPPLTTDLGEDESTTKNLGLWDDGSTQKLPPNTSRLGVLLEVGGDGELSGASDYQPVSHRTISSLFSFCSLDPQ